MRHINGRRIFQVSREDLARDGGAYVAPVRRGEEIVLVGTGKDMPGAGWMLKTSVLTEEDEAKV